MSLTTMTRVLWMLSTTDSVIMATIEENRRRLKLNVARFLMMTSEALAGVGNRVPFSIANQYGGCLSVSPRLGYWNSDSLVRPSRAGAAVRLAILFLPCKNQFIIYRLTIYN